MSAARRTDTYIAGPMRGHPEFNFPAFFEAERWAERWFCAEMRVQPSAVVTRIEWRYLDHAPHLLELTR